MTQKKLKKKKKNFMKNSLFWGRNYAKHPSEHLGDGRPVTAQRQAQPAELLGLLCTQYDKWQ